MGGASTPIPATAPRTPVPATPGAIAAEGIPAPSTPGIQPAPAQQPAQPDASIRAEAAAAVAAASGSRQIPQPTSEQMQTEEQVTISNKKQRMAHDEVGHSFPPGNRQYETGAEDKTHEAESSPKKLRRVSVEFPDGDEDVEMVEEDELFCKCDDLVNDEDDKPPEMLEKDLSEIDLKAEAEEEERLIKMGVLISVEENEEKMVVTWKHRQEKGG